MDLPFPPILTIPPELLLHILELGSHRSDDSRDGRRRRYLLRTSLVCRAFREPSQLLLWQTVIIKTLKQARAVLASPVVGRFGVQRLKIGNVVDAGCAGVLLAKVRVVGKLELEHFQEAEALKTEVFFSKTLRDVKSIHLEYVDLLETPNLISLGHLSLSTLSLNQLLSDSSAASPFLGPSLRNLSLNSIVLPTQDLHMEPLLPIADQLISLHLLHTDTYFQYLDTFLSELTNLQHLEITCSFSTLSYVTKLLPSQLVSLRFTPSPEDILDIDGVLSAAGTVIKLPCGRYLKEIMLPCLKWVAYADDTEESLIVEAKTRRAIILEWEKKGVKVKLWPDCGESTWV